MDRWARCDAQFSTGWIEVFMANEEQAAAAPIPVARKRRGPLLIGVVALLALAGGGYVWQAQKTAHAAASRENATDRPTPCTSPISSAAVAAPCPSPRACP